MTMPWSAGGFVSAFFLELWWRAWGVVAGGEKTQIPAVPQSINLIEKI